MKIKEYARFEGELSNMKIDEFSDWLYNNLLQIKTEKRNCIRVRLLAEEMLIRLQEHFGENCYFRAYIESSLRNHPKLRIVIEDEAFNPLRDESEEFGSWSSSLQTALGLDFKYNYSFGRNILKLNIPCKTMNPVLKIFIFLIIGAVLGLIATYLLNDHWQENLSSLFLTPAYELWSNILNTISAPIIFFTIVTTFLNTKQIDEQGGNSSNVVFRYFALSFLITAISAFVSVPIYANKTADIRFNKEVFTQIIDFIKQLVPTNIIEPFLTSNTPQLLLMALVLGAALVVLGNNVKTAKKVIRQINMVGLKLADWVSKLVPVFAALMLVLSMIKGEKQLLTGMWKPLVLSLVVSIFILFTFCLYVSLRLGVKPKNFGSKLQKPFLTALKTGSLDASYEHTKNSCINQLGIRKNYTDISLPQGLVLYMPISSVGIFIFTIYSARIYNVTLTLFWVISAVILAVILFVATPPVPGANLLAYVVFFAALGIPTEALMSAMIFDIIFGIFAGAGNQMLLQAEMAPQAKRIGIIDKEKLMA